MRRRLSLQTVDATSLFWVDGYAGGPEIGIHKMPLAGYADTIVASDEVWPSQLQIDDHCVYWSNPVKGTIEVAPKGSR